MRRRVSWFIAISLILVFPRPGISSPPQPASLFENTPIIALIIDDLGDHWQRDRQALRLPGAVTYSILPHTPYAQSLASLGHRQGKELMLHLPMEPIGGENMGVGGLSSEMTELEFIRTIQLGVANVPHIVGINNHMGSRLTQNRAQMQWLMAELEKHYPSLYFVDSMTSSDSVAHSAAYEYGIAHASRDVFLDNDRDFSAIAGQFHKLIALAKQRGSALAIAHPYPETLEYLDYWLPRLEEKGVRLVPVSDYLQTVREKQQLWRASLSPSHKVVKN